MLEGKTERDGGPDVRGALDIHRAAMGPQDAQED